MSQLGSQKYEVWFLTGTQNLYGDETLKQVAEQSSEVSKLLASNLNSPVEIVWKPILKTGEEIRQVMQEASSANNCIGVIVWMHTFSPAKMWISGLHALTKPLLHLHTQANSSLPWATIDMDFMNLNQAAHGDREHGHIQARMKNGRKIVVGHVSSPTVQRRISNWTRAAIGWHTAQNLKLARFGDNMRYVAVTDGDKTGAQIKLGFSVEAYGVNTLVDAVAKVSDKEIDALIPEYLSAYDVVDELKPGGARHDSLRYAASQEIALKKLLTAGDFGAFTTNFEDLGGLRQLPGLAVQRLMAQGYGFGGEGDWKTSAFLRIVKSMTAGLEGGTSFMEDYTYHFGPGEAKVLGAHMLEVCPTIASTKPKLEIHPLGIGDREDPVRLVFDATPGSGFVTCLTDMGDHYRIVTNEIEVIKPDAPLPNLPVARAVWKPLPSLEVSAESWIYAGGSHHTVMTTALDIEVMQDFAEIAGVELLEINAETNAQVFRHNIRWNSAALKFQG
ncbi:AraA L-arabinose isomerase [Candidatus Nanopelagicaceae bacterium]